ncbi:hypothetical protein [Thermococcus sp.]|uniref:hypothetical protein n=1 Tax=Thermococcus sp. TaxID=35749 RepID=UPI0025CF91D5|nr:hypothetical protein [Thermococcus sp.]
MSFAKSLLAGFSPSFASSLLIMKIQGSESAKAGYHQWRVEVWEDGKLEASRSGSIEVNSIEDFQKDESSINNTNLEITGFSCMPKEVGLYEWRLDKDKVFCTVNIKNNGPRIQIAPRVVIDDIETFWLNTRILSGNSSLTIKYEVKFSDGLAQIMYGPSATALSFVHSVEESGGTVCQRRVCYNTTRIQFLPKNHTISLRIYKAIDFIPTETLTQSEKEVITVKYDGYVKKKWTQYVIITPTFTLVSMYGASCLAPAIFGDMAVTGMGQTVLGGSTGSFVGMLGQYLIEDKSYGGDVS